MSKKKASVAKPRTKLVRIVPHNPSKGFLAQRVMVRKRIYTHQWTEVPAPVATQLSRMGQPDRPDVRLFDVKTEAEVRHMEQVEADKERRMLINRNSFNGEELRERMRKKMERDFDQDDFDTAEYEEYDDYSEEAEYEEEEDGEGEEVEDLESQWGDFEKSLVKEDPDEEVAGPPVPMKRRKKAAKKKATKKKVARGKATV